MYFPFFTDNFFLFSFWGLLILLNTFSSAVLFALGLPFLLFWPQMQNRLLATRNKNRPQSSKGEFDWIESSELLRTRMFRLIVTYRTLHGLKVSFSIELKNFLAQSLVNLIEQLVQCQYLRTYSSLPPTQQESTDNNLELILGSGRAAARFLRCKKWSKRSNWYLILKRQRWERRRCKNKLTSTFDFRVSREACILRREFFCCCCSWSSNSVPV